MHWRSTGILSGNTYNWVLPQYLLTAQYQANYRGSKPRSSYFFKDLQGDDHCRRSLEAVDTFGEGDDHAQTFTDALREGDRRPVSY